MDATNIKVLVKKGEFSRLERTEGVSEVDKLPDFF